MKKLIFISLLSLLTFSCKKNRTLHFTGKVVNAVTGEGVQGIELRLIESKKPDLSDPLVTESENVCSVVSDHDGRFEINYTGWNRYGYYILTEPDSETYKILGWNDGSGALRAVELEEIYDEFKIVPSGWRHTHTMNVNCIDDNDSANFELIYLLTNEVYSSDLYWTGCQNGTGYSKWNIGDYRYNWHVIRNGIRTDCTKVFTIYENDTTYIELFY